jgi:hypothetical protein
MRKLFLLTLSFITAVPSLSADAWDKLTRVSVHRPFRIGTDVVKPGSYVFRIAPSASDRTLLQIFDDKTGQLVLQVFGIPALRMEVSDKTVMRFRETRGEELQNLRDWFYPGERYGLEFLEASALIPQFAVGLPSPVTPKRPPIDPVLVPERLPDGNLPLIAANARTAVELPPVPVLPDPLPWSSRPDTNPSRTYADKWALIIGVGSTIDPATELKFAAKDARDVDTLFKDPTAGRFPADHVRLLVDEQARHSRIRAEIEWIGKRAKPGDLVVVYVSSHAFINIVTQRRYLVAYDSVLSDLANTGFEMGDFGKMLGTGINAQVLALLDACESGGMQDTPKGLSLSPNVVVMSSSRSTEDSWVSARLQNSFFTRLFVDTMWNTNGTLPLREIFNRLSVYLPSAVLAANGNTQHPVILSDNKGDAIVIGAPVAPR